MEPVVKRFTSHAAAAEADKAYYRALSHDQRMDIFLDLLNSRRPQDEASNKIAPVYKIIKLHDKR